MISSKVDGWSSRKNWVMPVLSSWKTSDVLPAYHFINSWIIIVNLLNIYEIPQIPDEIQGIPLYRYCSKAQKSIFTSPSSSRVFMGNWVEIRSSLRYRGTVCDGAVEITTPAAWVDAWRGMPSL